MCSHPSLSLFLRCCFPYISLLPPLYLCLLSLLSLLRLTGRRNSRCLVLKNQNKQTCLLHDGRLASPRLASPQPPSGFAVFFSFLLFSVAGSLRTGALALLLRPRVWERGFALELCTDCAAGGRGPGWCFPSDLLFLAVLSLLYFPSFCHPPVSLNCAFILPVDSFNRLSGGRIVLGDWRYDLKLNLSFPCSPLTLYTSTWTRLRSAGRVFSFVMSPKMSTKNMSTYKEFV